MENQKQYQIIIRKAKKMNHKEKAKELVERFYWKITENSLSVRQAKQCALICVDEILKFHDRIDVDYWNEVKQEIKEI